jgi:hypothetical protein
MINEIAFIHEIDYIDAIVIGMRFEMDENDPQYDHARMELTT